MNSSITYIYRKRLPQYNSIEELFRTIELEVSKKTSTYSIEMEHSGASPMWLLKNLMSFDKMRDDIKHITGDVHYMAMITGKNTVLTIHDIKSASNGNFLKVFYMRLFWFWLPALFVNRITVISEFTKQELGKIIPFAKDKIKVVYNPVNARLKATPFIFNDKKPHILLVGTKPNKNLERSFEALKDISCKLTIIGALSAIQLMILEKLEIDFENKLHLNFDEVVGCYENCDVLCFPSTYEGFGMPIIEAQAVGRPVLTSNMGAMKEVALNSACLVNPYDVDAISEGLLRIITDKNYREDLVAKGLKNVERFQATKIARDYLEVYQELKKE